MTAAPHRVAVVLESDPFFREFQTFLLSRRGHSVLAPTDTKQLSAAWVRDQRPVIVVTEILLPGINGLDLVRALRAAPGLTCPIIVYSVLRMEERALAAGADRFLLKPLVRDSYLSALDDALKHTSQDG